MLRQVASRLSSVSLSSRAGFAAAARSSAAAATPAVVAAAPVRAASLLSPVQGLPESAVEYYQTAKSFADTEFAPFASKWDEDHHFPEEALRKAASLGFGALYVDPAHGGSGLSRLEGIPIIEALAGADTSTAAYLTIHNMVAWMIDTFGAEDLKKEWLPQLATMDKFSSYCLTEPNSGSDAASLSTKAVKDGDDYVLNGSKMFISGGGRSDVYAVMARTSGSGPNGISCFLVPHPSPGLTFGKQEKKMGWRTQPTAAVFLENVRVPARNMLGKEGDGFRIAMRGLNGGRLSIAACSLGAAQTCTELACDYIKTRKQFGKPIAANQALQFKVADMATKLASARLTVHHAARLLDAKDAHAAAYCAMAKRLATDNGFDVVNTALQMFGGYGYLSDWPIERFLRDVRVHQILEGTNEIMSVILSRAILTEGEGAAGAAK